MTVKVIIQCTAHPPVKRQETLILGSSDISRCPWIEDRIADIEITVSKPRTEFTVSGFRASHIKAAPES